MNMQDYVAALVAAFPGAEVLARDRTDENGAYAIGVTLPDGRRHGMYVRPVDGAFPAVDSVVERARRFLGPACR